MWAWKGAFCCISSSLPRFQRPRILGPRAARREVRCDIWSNRSRTAGAISWGPNRLDVFARGTNNALYHISSDDNGSDWNPAWEDLGGAIESAPTAVSWGPGRIDLFVAQAGTGAIYQKDYNGTAWSPSWLPLNGVAWGSSVPIAITTGVGSIQVFVQGTDRGLYATSLESLDANGTPSWYPWGNLGSCFAAGGAPSVVSRDGNTLDVFVTSAPDANHLTPVFHDTTNAATVGVAAALPTCPLGDLDEPCGNNGTCNGGWTCNEGVCGPIDPK
jgi:hypothetical protein